MRASIPGQCQHVSFCSEAETDIVGYLESKGKRILDPGQQAVCQRCSDLVQCCRPDSDLKAERLSQEEAIGLLTVCLKSSPESQIAELVAQLSSSEADHLLQLVYLGLAQAQAPISTVMLKWHEHIVCVCGLGAIMRILTC